MRKLLCLLGFHEWHTTYSTFKGKHYNVECYYCGKDYSLYGRAKLCRFCENGYKEFGRQLCSQTPWVITTEDLRYCPLFKANIKH